MFSSNFEMENVRLKCSDVLKCDRKINQAQQIKLHEAYINKTDVCKLDFEIVKIRVGQYAKNF